MRNAELDRRILAQCGPQWQKVARIAYHLLQMDELTGKWWADRAITKRIIRLGMKGEIELAGNMYNWRASEVRLAVRQRQ